MTRQIKFRAWDKKYKAWIKGFAIWTNGVISDDGEKVFMQYTGLKDKNGKEGYLGDITFTEDGEFSKTCEICCIEEYLEFFLKDIYTSDTYSLEEIGDFEIIGNIYENPELLK